MSLNKQSQLATREAQLFSYYFSILPDPDEVLAKEGGNILVYRRLLNDAHLFAVMEKRKASVLSMLWEVETPSGSRQAEAKFYNDYFANIDLHGLIELVLDAVFYGFQPFVINWDLVNNLRIPRLEDRPHEYFFFDKDNNPRIRVKNSNDGILCDPFNFIFARHKPTYNNPYGVKVASKVFWPVAFKKADVKFWLTMTEKFGMPFMLGKTGGGSSEADVKAFLEMLNNMAQDGIGVAKGVDTVELLNASGTVNGDIYKGLIEHCNAEISKAVLTVTNTVELQGGTGSYAASKVHKEGEDAQALSDARLVMNFMNDLIKLIHRVNFGTAQPPRFSLYPEDAIDKSLAERDQILTGTGIKFTKDYYKRTYNLSDEDFDLSKTEPKPKSSQFSEPTSPGSLGGVEVPDTLLQLQIEQALAPVINLVNTSQNYSEVLDNLAGMYPNMRTTQLESLLERAILISELYGAAKVADKQ
jgi:phage gp29-like protein